MTEEREREGDREGEKEGKANRIGSEQIIEYQAGEGERDEDREGEIYNRKGTDN